MRLLFFARNCLHPVPHMPMPIGLDPSTGGVSWVCTGSQAGNPLKIRLAV